MVLHCLTATSNTSLWCGIRIFHANYDSGIPVYLILYLIIDWKDKAWTGEEYRL